MIVATADVFSHTHIALTAGTTAVIAFGFAIWRLSGPRAWIDRVVTTCLKCALGVMSASAMPCVSRQGGLRVRRTDAGEVGAVRVMSLGIERAT